MNFSNMNPVYRQTGPVASGGMLAALIYPLALEVIFVVLQEKWRFSPGSGRIVAEAIQGKQGIRFPIGFKLVTIISILVLVSLGTITVLVSVLVSEDIRLTAEDNNFTYRFLVISFFLELICISRIRRRVLPAFPSIASPLLLLNLPVPTGN